MAYDNIRQHVSHISHRICIYIYTSIHVDGHFFKIDLQEFLSLQYFIVNYSTIKTDSACWAQWDPQVHVKFRELTLQFVSFMSNLGHLEKAIPQMHWAQVTWANFLLCTVGLGRCWDGAGVSPFQLWLVVPIQVGGQAALACKVQLHKSYWKALQMDAFHVKVSARKRMMRRKSTISRMRRGAERDRKTGELSKQFRIL